MRTCAVSVAIAMIALVTAGCGTTTRSAAPSSQTVASAFKGSPPSLAALHAQANRLLGGGRSAFKARLAALRGYPVVVNQWASWCGPCQSEFPVFQKVAVTLGKRVAFLGVDGKDADPAAASFLRHFPLTYPSYTDPHQDIARALQTATGYPQTIYFDRHGTLVFDHAGPYLSASALEHDIGYYVLNGK